MLFWITILVGIMVSYLATRIGFYESLVYGFNLSLAIYLAVFLTPYVVTHVPAATEIGMGLPLTLVGLTVGAFLLLHVISFLLFTGQFTIAFPKVIDLPLSAIIGFWAGILLVSLVALVLSIVPAAAIETLFDARTLQTHTWALAASCDRIHRFAKSGDAQVDSKEILSWLNERKASLSQATDATDLPETPPPAETVDEAPAPDDALQQGRETGKRKHQDGH